MGGWLTMAIREADGTEYISERNTNWLPDWLVNPLFWTGKKVVKQYIVSGLNAFTPVERAFPSQYGIVVIDFVTKKVLCRNGYTSVGRSSCVALGSQKARQLTDMIRRGWVTRYECWRNEGEGEERYRDLDEEEIKEFHKLVEHWLHPTKEEETRLKGGGRSYHFARFKTGMVTVHFTPKGWQIDSSKDDGRLREEWDEVRNFIKDNGWKSKSWTQGEVTRKYGDPPPKKPKKKAKAA